MKANHGVCRFVVLLVSALSLTGAHGATLYVSTSGSDSNPGTAAQPFRTITYAYSKASAGTTILVAPGVYTDYMSGTGLFLGKSGTASSPIVLESQVQGGAVIDGKNASDRNEAVYITGSYNVVNGFEIRNGPNGGITIWGNGNQIVYNDIHHNGTPASTTTYGRCGVYDDHTTSGNMYVGNYIHENGRTGGSSLDHGLYLCGDNEQVLNNVMIRNNSRGLHVAGYTTVSNLRVYSNVIAWNGGDGLTLWMDMNGVVIQNNILYHNGDHGVQFYSVTGSGVVMDHNLVYGNTDGSFSLAEGKTTVSYTLGTTIASDPRFLNETSSAFDAHLASGSPAIGAGLNLSSYFTIDMDEVKRPASGAWDLGAYVYRSGDTTAPTVSLTSPVNGATVSGTISPSASASDNVGVTSVQFTWDGANLGSALTAAPYTMSVNTISSANGSHSLSAVARDAAGNQTTATPITVTVNNPLPTIALTSPVSGARYAAPATISLASSVTANGHTISQVRYFNGSTLLGTATASPYTVTWGNVAASTYGVSATAVYDGGRTVVSPIVTVSVTNPPASSVTVASTSGTISSPFYVTNSNAIVQPASTAITAGGQALYTFNILTAGNYLVSALVSAPSTDNNSFYVNIDAQPTDPTMIWDLVVNSGLASQTLSWRGNGTISTNSLTGLTAQFAPKVFSLSAGSHQLIVRGREGKAQLGTITITPTTLSAN